MPGRNHHDLAFELNWWRVSTKESLLTNESLDLPVTHKFSLLVTGFNNIEQNKIISKSVNLGANYKIYTWRDNIDPLYAEYFGSNLFCEFDELLITANKSVLTLVERFLTKFPVRCYERIVYGLTDSEIHSVCENSSYRIIPDLYNLYTKAVSTDNKDCAFELTLRSDFKHN